MIVPSREADLETRYHAPEKLEIAPGAEHRYASSRKSRRPYSLIHYYVLYTTGVLIMLRKLLFTRKGAS